jgi:hypothetical protein
LVGKDQRNQNNKDDYGIAFTKTTLKLLPQFLSDTKALQQSLQVTIGKNNARS